jgi:hypothetical protein
VEHFGRYVKINVIHDSRVMNVAVHIIITFFLNDTLITGFAVSGSCTLTVQLRSYAVLCRNSTSNLRVDE